MYRLARHTLAFDVPAATLSETELHYQYHSHFDSLLTHQCMAYYIHDLVHPKYDYSTLWIPNLSSLMGALTPSDIIAVRSC